MDLADVMEEVAGKLQAITGLRVFSCPPDAVAPPAAYVDYPEDITFDGTYGRGMDRMTLPVALVVGRVTDVATRDRLAKYCDGAGAASVKVAVQAGRYVSCDTVRVMTIDFDYVLIEGSPHIEARFNLDITGSGSA